MYLNHIHGAKKFKTKWFLLGAVFTGLLASTLSFANRYTADEKEIVRLKQSQRLTQEADKIKRFILLKQPIVWDSLAEELATNIVDASASYKVPIDLMVGISCVESEFYVYARSSTGAKGITQVDFTAWKEELGTKGNPYDPSYNIQCGAYILSRNLKTHGVRKGLHIYNVGEGNYRNGRRNPKYVDKVYAAASEFRYFN